MNISIELYSLICDLGEAFCMQAIKNAHAKRQKRQKSLHDPQRKQALTNSKGAQEALSNLSETDFARLKASVYQKTKKIK